VALRCTTVGRWPGRPSRPGSRRDEPSGPSGCGGPVRRFALRGVGGPALELVTTDWLLAAGAPLAIEWTRSERDDLRVHVSMSVDQHGIAPSSLECEAADAGSLTVPAGMVDALLELGQSGIPSARIQRLSVDSAEVGPGCADLTVSSTVRSSELTVRVAGPR
jgi:hypothetical protein